MLLTPSIIIYINLKLFKKIQQCALLVPSMFKIMYPLNVYNIIFQKG